LVFELMALLFKPGGTFRWSEAGLANLTDPFGGVCEIEDPHGLGTMKIEEALDPLGPIGWGHHVGRLFHAPPG
jgi:hypothetical protein